MPRQKRSHSGQHNGKMYVMEKFFTKDFVKFLFGFVAMVVATLTLVYITQVRMDAENQRADSAQTPPATTQSN